MERLTLTPTAHEIVINHGADQGAVDVFTYSGDEQSSHDLGSLYVIGHRAADSANMEYMVSLIAALARREYYAQPGVLPKDAFSRTLRRVNEVVDEFFRANGATLSVGVVAIAGATILVSKLDKFKILLARDDQVIDILNNVMLFSKEHVEKRQFSSIISGSVQAGDRLLAYVPTKDITSRERSIKTWLRTLDMTAFTEKINGLARQHPSLGAAFIGIDMQHVREVLSPRPERPIAAPAPALPPQEPVLPTEPAAFPQPTLAWSPRQGRPIAATPAAAPTMLPEESTEIPHIIPTEYSFGSRVSRFQKIAQALRIVRLDARGKAIALAGATAVVVLAVFLVKSIWFTNPQEQQLKQALRDISTEISTARTNIAQQQVADARTRLIRALASLSGQPRDNGSVRDLTASITKLLDDVDHAAPATLTLFAQSEVPNEKYIAATWSSASASVWSIARTDDALAVVELRDGVAVRRTPITGESFILRPWNTGVLAIDVRGKTITRIVDGITKTWPVTTQDDVIDAAIYDGNCFMLTSGGVLKIIDLDTDKPVTKLWLTNTDEFVRDASMIWVDGSVRTLGRTGTLVEYYKGKRAQQATAALALTGPLTLLPLTNGDLAVASTDTRRMHFITVTGELQRTLTVDTEQQLISAGVGPDDSILIVTKDGKIWSAK